MRMKKSKDKNFIKLDPHQKDALRRKDEFIFSQIQDRDAMLKDFGIEKIVSVDLSPQIKNPPNERIYWYENQQLKFKLSNGSIDQFDFEKATISRKMFETFWNLWQGDESSEYTQIQVRQKYKELFGNDPGDIGKTVANIRTSIIYPKAAINGRIEWRFNRKKQVWMFKIT